MSLRTALPHAARMSRAVTLLAAAAALAACGGGGGPGGGAPAVSPPHIPATPRPAPAGTSPRMPLDQYNTVPDSSAVTAAENLLTERCMRQKGFTYSPGAATSPLAPILSAAGVPATPGTGGTIPQAAAPYGIDSGAQAAKYGYHDATVLEVKNYLRSHPSARAQSPLAQHPAAYWIALNGQLPGSRTGQGGPYGGGCSGRAAQQVGQYQKNQAVLELPGQLEAQAQSDTERDTRVIRAESAWSACMAARGLHYPTPMAAATARWPLVVSADGTLVPSPREIATAEADVACKTRTNLPGIWLAVQAGYERELIAANQVALTASLRDSQAEARRAEHILAAAHG